MKKELFFQIIFLLILAAILFVIVYPKYYFATSGNIRGVAVCNKITGTVQDYER